MSNIREIFEPTTGSFLSKRGVIKLPEGNTLSNKQRSFLDLAVKVAEASEVTHRHGAVVVKAGKPVSLGINKWRNRELLNTMVGYNPHLTVHAEVDALSRVADARGATVFVARVGKANEEKFSRPCDNCTKALIAAGVKAVIYTVG